MGVEHLTITIRWKLSLQISRGYRDGSPSSQCTAIGLGFSRLLMFLCSPNTKELMYNFLMNCGRLLFAIFVRSVCTICAYGFGEFLLSVYVTIALITSEMSPSGPAALTLGILK